MDTDDICSKAPSELTSRTKEKDRLRPFRKGDKIGYADRLLRRDVPDGRNEKPFEAGWIDRFSSTVRSMGQRVFWNGREGFPLGTMGRQLCPGEGNQVHRMECVRSMYSVGWVVGCLVGPAKGVVFTSSLGYPKTFWVFGWSLELDSGDARFAMGDGHALALTQAYCIVTLQGGGWVGVTRNRGRVTNCKEVFLRCNRTRESVSSRNGEVP